MESSMEYKEESSKMFDRDPYTATIGNEILPFETSYLTEFFQKKAEVELNDTPERRIQGLMQIKEMIKNEPCMKDINFKDDFLFQYLRVGKFIALKAFSRLKAFVTFKEKNPDIFNICFENIIKTVTYGLATLLPYRCQDGCVILLIQVEHWYPDLFPLEEVKQMYALILMQSSRNIMTQVNGFKVIFDFKTKLQHLPYCTPQNLYLLSHATQECFPSRYKGVHIVNGSLTLKIVWTIIKPILPTKLKKRIYFHSSSEALLNYFPKETLPVQYGGTLVNYDMTQWLRKMTQPAELEAMLKGKYPPNSTMS